MPLGYPPVYPVPRFDQTTTTATTTYYEPQRLVQQHPNSPDSISSTSSPPTPPSTTTSALSRTVTMHPSSSTSTISSTSSSSSSLATANSSTPYTNILTSQALDHNTTPTMINPLVPSSFSNATTARVKETIARANSVPMEFYHTEFLEYSKETYERKMDAKRNKRKRPQQNNNIVRDESLSQQEHNNKRSKKQQQQQQQNELVDDKEDSEDDLDEDDLDKVANAQGLSSAELRRQIHIQSEQKRRAQIKDGFDELRKHLPGCNNKKMSKAALLTRTVQQIQHLKSMQSELLAEVERLVQENENLKKFQHGVLQRQAMEKMYNF
ncbi:uncharacterized protein BX664DRAFT_132534 [Halteromyces radiatus]|uniref:uncharacterized protein n=1 Tax=Halteromyces radiatus TaxID=101107 RepID=UPI00221EC5C9|nr:uncharacterized protein BX664DRAFT_132534 [Halteromyces radiatus]KAI8089356.1 hypothetical protein BX664DRAFT_132534 [Halteromyces radiatus]